MAKISKWWGEKGWVLMLGVIVVGMYIYGYREMFFHQDDLDWMLLVNKPLIELMKYPVADHINYVFRLLFKMEWELFGLQYPPYLMVSLLLHSAMVYLLYLLVYLTTDRRDLPLIAAILFSINTNWNEVILWTSGQTISITAVLVLWAMIQIWNRRRAASSIAWACLTSALALGLPVSAMLVYGIEGKKRKITALGWRIMMIILAVALIYGFWRTDGTSVALSWGWLGKVIIVWGLAIINTAIGRLVIPFDRYEVIRIVSVTGLVLVGLARWRDKLAEIWRDSWSRFLILQIGFYYLIVAIGRAQYGVGIMRAERYGYLGLALILLLSARVLRQSRTGKWGWIVGAILILQSAGFYTRARAYTQRPQQLKALLQQVRVSDPSQIDGEAYLPHFVLNDERLKYRDLMILINH